MSAKIGDELVRRYLLERGYDTTLKSLEEDMKRTNSVIVQNGMNASILTQSNGDVADMDIESEIVADLSNFHEDLITEGIFNGEFCIYDRCYDMYRDWASGSLDMIQTELISICFPLFVCRFHYFYCICFDL
jgi:hypothetical protein